MAIDNHFMQKKVLQKDQLIAAFCASTNMPYVICDPVSFEDQVWIFSDEDGFREFAERFAAKKLPLRGLAIKKNNYPAFFSSLIPIGITEVVFTENGANAKIPLDQFVKKQDMSNVPILRRPLENPSLQLTGIYLMQEVKRQVPNEEKEDLPSLNEEFLINLARSRFLMPIEVKKGPGTPEERIRKGQVGFVNINTKNGDSFRPIFSDTFEFNKFKQKKDFQAVTLPFAGLKQAMPKDVKGFIMNPVGCSVVITSQLIEQVLKNFPEEVQKGAEETRKLVEAQAAAAKAPVKAPVSAPVKAPVRAPLANGHSKITKMPEKK